MIASCSSYKIHEYLVEIIDDVGNIAANQKLSEDRASAVRDYLVKRGAAYAAFDEIVPHGASSSESFLVRSNGADVIGVSATERGIRGFCKKEHDAI